MGTKKICINKQLIYLFFLGIFLVFLFTFFTYQNNQKQTTQSRASAPAVLNVNVLKRLTDLQKKKTLTKTDIAYISSIKAQVKNTGVGATCDSLSGLNWVFCILGFYTPPSPASCYAFTASQANMDNFLKGTPLPTPPLGFVVNDCTFLLPTEAPAFRAATTQQKISYVMVEPKKLNDTNEIMTWCQKNLSAGCSLNGGVLKIGNSAFGVPLVIAAADGTQYFTGLALSGTAEEATALSASTTLLSPFVVAYLVVNPGIVQDVIESDVPQEQVAKTRIRLDAYGKLIEELKAKESEIDAARTKVQAGASEDTWVTYIDDNGKFQSSQQKPPKCGSENNSGSTPASQRIGKTGTTTLKLVAEWQKTNPALAQKIYQSGDQMYDILRTLPQSDINTLMSQLNVFDSGIPDANLAMIGGKLFYPSQLLNEIKRGIAPFCQEMDLSWLTQSERENVLRFLEELYKIKFP
jgi:hypothetical protein